MIENYDLKTVNQQVTNTPVDLGIGAVPSGMTRHITYIKSTNTYTASTTLHVAEGVDATTLTAIKDRQKLGSGDTIMYPDSPDADKPIMSIATGKYLALQTANANETDDVTIGYYDE
jgi:hypothetical protein